LTNVDVFQGVIVYLYIVSVCTLTLPKIPLKPKLTAVCQSRPFSIDQRVMTQASSRFLHLILSERITITYYFILCEIDECGVCYEV